jgi:hypothetical protein
MSPATAGNTLWPVRLSIMDTPSTARAGGTTLLPAQVSEKQLCDFEGSQFGSPVADTAQTSFGEWAGDVVTRRVGRSGCEVRIVLAPDEQRRRLTGWRAAIQRILDGIAVPPQGEPV